MHITTTQAKLIDFKQTGSLWKRVYVQNLTSIDLTTRDALECLPLTDLVLLLDKTETGLVGIRFDWDVEDDVEAVDFEEVLSFLDVDDDFELNAE